jgi:hypothetical protein
MQEATQSWAPVDPDTMEGLIGSATDGDVVRVPGHPIGTEREHDVGSFVAEEIGNA